ncbi:NAD-dependent epimerase/dehydratase family protein [Neomicrococcus aestuarii]|uniref:NAD-dependent epimerase/dehydratase domain-containing protein n=1 Tax=Neomicrococcus aestuarii TaxID=556325 RepID=A0A1L2ZNV5_9MICC|nr:NAD-dependent epimerase/dehydratase family protein [Neomicrococcus aestuarii]APF40859.1 hypothetical protein BHE16_07335 [Neomicrococcus aestuarii]
MSRILILGAGGIARETAAELLSRNHDVTVGSRSGKWRGGVVLEEASQEIIPERYRVLKNAEHRVLDASNAGQLTEASAGFDAIVNAMNPANYGEWAKTWPPINNAVLAAASHHGLKLVITGNLYGYGKVSAPMTESTPLRPNGTKGAVRVQMWEDALAEHRAGNLRVAEVRSSDYLGVDIADQSYLGSFLIKPVSHGKTAWLPVGRKNAPHTWTSVRDAGRLIARIAELEHDDAAWGHPWHAPSAPAVSFQLVAEQVAQMTGHVARVREVPAGAIGAASLFVPILRELKETKHQFEEPFVMDDSAAREYFGMSETPWKETLREVVGSLG